MSNPVIAVENLSKSYRLGQIGTGTLTDDLSVWIARMRGKPNPLLRIGQEDHGNRDGEILWALKDVSFQVEQGEVLGIIGRNGAGKSTLLKILSRVTAPSSGCVKVKGRIASLLEVGTGFHPDLTGRENIYLNGAILGMTKEEVNRKFDEIVAFAEIEKFIDTPVKRYSSGMYVRLAFAVAAHLNPEILIVDEVLAVGDSEFQKKCLGKMEDVSHQGRTVIFVSHNMDSIEHLCLQCLWLEKGTIHSYGKTNTIVNEYLSSTLPKSDLSLNWSIRKGTQNFYYSNLKIIRNNDLLQSREFKTGDSIRCLLLLHSDKDYSRVFVGLQIVDSHSNIVFSFNSQERGFRYDIQKGVNSIALVIPFLPLLPGTYYINLVALLPDKRISDEINMADSFNVHPTDHYASGHPFLSEHGRIFIDYSWESLNGK
jgi:lipopolysaccharide transport system ATP-binding protein